MKGEHAAEDELCGSSAARGEESVRLRRTGDNRCVGGSMGDRFCEADALRKKLANQGRRAISCRGPER